MKYRDFNERKFDGGDLSEHGEMNKKWRRQQAGVRVVLDSPSARLFLSINFVDTSVCVEQLTLDLSGLQQSGL
jgi:hypothetical protein